MTYEEAERLAIDAGFTHTARLDCSTLVLREEVRQMCQANTCGMYGKNKACPPECGSLEECRARAAGYRWGILLQTVGELEDSMDFEGMQALEKKHKRSLGKLVPLLRQAAPDMLPLGAGCCTVCRVCAGPEESCRFPEKRISSMEAYGIVVSDLCRDNAMRYYYGPGTLAYTACCLIE